MDTPRQAVFPSDPEKAALEQQPQLDSSNGFHVPLAVQSVQDNRRKRRGRFLKGFFAGVLLFFGLKMLTGDVMYHLATRIRGGCNHGHQILSVDWLNEDTYYPPGEFPIPPDLTVDHCAEWPEAPEPPHHPHHPHDFGEPEALDENDPHQHQFSQWNAFKLPVSSDFLFLVSRGSWSTGAVEIGQSDEPGDDVLVNVTTYYRHPHVLEHAQVCQLKRQENEVGVGVFSTNPPHRRPPHRHHRLPVWFHIDVTLPSGTEESPLNLKSFATSLGIFPHSVGDLAKTVRFGNLELKAAVAPISVKSVIAEKAVVETSTGSVEGNFATSSSLKLSTVNGHIKANALSLGEAIVKNANGPIVGNFSTKDRLVLSTANAPILVNLTLINTDEDTPTEVKLDTAHGVINGNLTLYSIGSDSTSPTSNPGGSFKISAHNAAGPITLLTPQAPINSTVNLKADTALGSVDVQMHPTFEGRFSVKNALGKIQVGLDDENVEDPDERGRKRVLNFGKVGGSTTGKVYWGEETGVRGEVNVDTTLADVNLRL